MEEKSAPSIDQIVWMCDGAYSPGEAKRMEMLVLRTFNWACCVATSLEFADLLRVQLNLPNECMALSKAYSNTTILVMLIDAKTGCV